MWYFVSEWEISVVTDHISFDKIEITFEVHLKYKLDKDTIVNTEHIINNTKNLHILSTFRTIYEWNISMRVLFLAAIPFIGLKSAIKMGKTLKMRLQQCSLQCIAEKNDIASATHNQPESLSQHATKNDQFVHYIYIYIYIIFTSFRKTLTKRKTK